MADARGARPSSTPIRFVDAESAPLLLDLYELTMAQVYLEERRTDRAVFELFFRSLPRRGFALACGLDDVLAFLEGLRFSRAHVDHLASTGLFSDRLLAWLEAFRFTGEVRAVPEGTPVFPGEPILSIEAPLPEAQIVETFVLNAIHLQTVLATKAARVVLAAQGRRVVDFGARRMHGVDAALKGARAFFVAGVDATSDVLAGRAFGMNVVGTMAHSFVQAHDGELEAFRAFARAFPTGALLVDTYDPIRGVQRVVELSAELGEGFRVGAVRIDSGDLGELCWRARRILDEAGLASVRIIASGGLDEEKIDALVQAGAPIDVFGVGTAMGVSDDAPTLDMAYKLVEYAGEGRVKTSEGKRTLPCAKQVFREEADGVATRDVLARKDEEREGRPLLERVMEKGRRTAAGKRSLAEARERARREISALPPEVRSLTPARPYEVLVSDALRQAAEDARARTRS